MNLLIPQYSSPPVFSVLDVNILIFNRFTKPSDPDIVFSPATTIHADPHLRMPDTGFKQSLICELATLIRVYDLIQYNRSMKHFYTTLFWRDQIYLSFITIIWMLVSFLFCCLIYHPTTAYLAKILVARGGVTFMLYRTYPPHDKHRNDKAINYPIQTITAFGTFW